MFHTFQVENKVVFYPAIAPAIEVVEKRGVFNADLPLAFAGNAQQRAFVTGEFVPLADELDPAAVEVEVHELAGRGQHGVHPVAGQQLVEATHSEPA